MLLRIVILLIILMGSFSVCANAEKEKKKTEEAKVLSGISIIGNKDAPKSLYIVPWRGSELEMETDLNSSLLNEGLHPVDKEVFIRELDFYESSKVK